MADAAATGRKAWSTPYWVFSDRVTRLRPWHPVDSLAWLKAMAWDLRGNMTDETGAGSAAR